MSASEHSVLAPCFVYTCSDLARKRGSSTSETGSSVRLFRRDDNFLECFIDTSKLIRLGKLCNPTCLVALICPHSPPDKKAELAALALDPTDVLSPEFPPKIYSP